MKQSNFPTGLLYINSCWKWKICRRRIMALMRGEPLLRKLAALAQYVVLPGAMAAALIYSPPDYIYSKKDDKSSK
ncbi:hypothetical protein IC582_015208 [Cucumis melo]